MNHDQTYEMPTTDTALSSLMVGAMTLVGGAILVTQAVQVFVL